jgi:hypothetical protein
MGFAAPMALETTPSVTYKGLSEVTKGAATRRGLCYDQHHVWIVTVVVTLPETLPYVLRGKWDQWAKAVPHPNVGAPSRVISSDIGYLDVCVA